MFAIYNTVILFFLIASICHFQDSYIINVILIARLFYISFFLHFIYYFTFILCGKMYQILKIDFRVQTQQTQNICMTFVQRRPHLYDICTRSTQRLLR